MTCRVLAQKAPEGAKNIHREPEGLAALAMARSFAAPEDLVLVTGSLYLVAELRTAVLEGA
jgi:folylpolyglutamate synthase/dihydropteroate synthase